MKYINLIAVLSILALGSCEKALNIPPESNLNSATFYSNATELQQGLNAAYSQLQKSLNNEWQMTELRSDNSKMGNPGSQNNFNRDLTELDIFIPSPVQEGIYTYWINTYAGIRFSNIVLQRLGITYNPATGAITQNPISISGITDTEIKQLAGEAMFIRAYHYFNLVRLYGGVFLVHTPISAAEAKTLNRSSVADIYKMIEADLNTGATWMNSRTYSQAITSANVANQGKANAWAAKGLLGKVLLTQGKKAEAIIPLQDVVTNSGYGINVTYPNVFSTSTEMNADILFAIRFKSGGLGQGSPFGNFFAPLSSVGIILGTSSGWNTPTSDIDSSYSISAPIDARKALNIGVYLPGASQILYVKKFLSPVTIQGDGESDWPILRFADVMLLLSEAEGNTTASVGRISAVKVRAGLAALPAGPYATLATFEKELADERRREFAFENQRWFDIVRYGTTMTTINAVNIMRAHFAYEFFAHYRLYVAPAPTVLQLQSYVTPEKLLLPIPQKEIDTNTQLVIPQNPGY